jgi:osmoprotectant transport system substrate-binding protein
VPRDRVRRSRWAALLPLVLFPVACGGGGGGPAVVVGSTNFTEQEIVANMYADVLAAAGYEVEERFQLGSREVVLPALESGDIDLYPEYVGTALEFLNGGAGQATSDTDATTELLRAEFEERGVSVLEPAEAQDKNALVVTRETAEQYGLATVSDLQPVAGELVLGGPPECPTRPLCLPGYEQTYGLDFAEFRPLDAGGPLTQTALDSGDIDVALMFSSQGVIAENDWVALEDDRGLQPAENLVPVIRTEVLTPEIEQLLAGVSAALTTEELTELNRLVDVEGEDPAVAAEQWLTEQELPE